ncbi:MAG: DUF1801 domain-containing protein [Phycisphaerae bacterium]|nr:DUF1801 domain-containing protein [Phycisphaerae bacterium]
MNPQTVDEYIAASAPEVRAILEKVRQTVRRAAPRAEEGISYRMPVYKLYGVVVWFGAFKGHIGLYPPVRGDAALRKASAPYAGPKGNLRFPLDRPVPYGFIGRIVRWRVKQNLAKNRRGGRMQG